MLSVSSRLVGSKIQKKWGVAQLLHSTIHQVELGNLSLSSIKKVPNMGCFFSTLELQLTWRKKKKHVWKICDSSQFNLSEVFYTEKTSESDFDCDFVFQNPDL